MAMDIYVPVETDVIHKTKADFSKNISQRVIHLVQYDKKLPVIDIELFTDGEPYVIPGSAEVYALWGNNDNTYVRIKCMTNNARTHVYFKVEQEMCYLYGQVNPILELVVGDNRAGSSSIPVVIDRNPVQEYYVPAILPEGGIPLNALSKEGATTETYIGFDGTNIVWKTVSGGGGGGGGTVTSIQAGEGLSTAPDSSQSGGTITTSGSLYLVKSGVNEGTYTKVVVDKYGRVTAGYSLSDTDIPNLPASKITSGTLDTARIPNLPASKITSGVLDVDRIPALGYYTKPQAGIPLTDISVQGAATNKYLGYDGTNLVWKTVSAGSVTEIIAGDGLTTTQDSSTSGGSITSSGTLYLAITGVTAGTYMKVAVDKYGRVTAGYSITDADIPALPVSKITFSSDQLAALGSGITQAKVNIYDEYSSNKQDTLVSGTNIKTVNNQSILGSGNISFPEPIIDVDELPTTNIQTNKFYRTEKLGEKVIQPVPNDFSTPFCNLMFNTNLSVSEVMDIISNDDIEYLDVTTEMGGMSITFKTYVIDWGDINDEKEIYIVYVPDSLGIPFALICNQCFVDVMSGSTPSGNPNVLWCNNGDILYQLTQGMLNLTGWNPYFDNPIDLVYVVNSIGSGNVAISNYLLTDLVWCTKYTSYKRIIEMYEDGDPNTTNINMVKDMFSTVFFENKSCEVSVLPTLGDTSTIKQNILNGTYPYAFVQYNSNTVALVAIIYQQNPVTHEPMSSIIPYIYVNLIDISDAFNPTPIPGYELYADAQTIYSALLQSQFGVVTIDTELKCVVSLYHYKREWKKVGEGGGVSDLEMQILRDHINDLEYIILNNSAKLSYSEQNDVVVFYLEDNPS